MSDEKTTAESEEQVGSIVERWLADQQAWQKTTLAYLDSMASNDDFLVHLGNAMRGSLLGGKPYPGPVAAGAAEPLSEADGRIDEILHTLHLLQGEMRDVKRAIDRLDKKLASTTSKKAKTKKRKKTKSVSRRQSPAQGAAG